MKHKKLRFARGFRVVFGNRKGQAAEMVLPPGDAEGDPSNRHRGADQWLFVEGARKNAPGGWATGSFDAKRNKLSIDTRDVDAFAVEIAKIPIDWDRVVILGIDGENAELRRRSAARLHFIRDKHGQWTIAE